MASKARDAIEKLESGESHVCSSGVKIWVRPIPPKLWRKILAKAEKDYPYPPIPKKTINVLDGTEEVDDLTNPDYVAKKSEVDAERINDQGEALVDFCVDVDGGIEQYSEKITSIEKRLDEKYPDDLESRRTQFLNEYVIRGVSDWQFVFTSAVEQAQITDPEVSARVDSFRDNMERAKANGSTPSSIDEVERVAV